MRYFWIIAITSMFLLLFLSCSGGEIDAAQETESGPNQIEEVHNVISTDEAW